MIEDFVLNQAIMRSGYVDWSDLVEERGCCINCDDAHEGCLCYECKCTRCCWYIPRDETGDTKGNCGLALSDKHSCKYCDSEISWKNINGKWVPLDFKTGHRHFCKERFGQTKRPLHGIPDINIAKEIASLLSANNDSRAVFKQLGKFTEDQIDLAFDYLINKGLIKELNNGFGFWRVVRRID